jgi:hypothetical protein
MTGMSKMLNMSIVGDIKMDFPNKHLFKTVNVKGVPYFTEKDFSKRLAANSANPLSRQVQQAGETSPV